MSDQAPAPQDQPVEVQAPENRDQPVVDAASYEAPFNINEIEDEAVRGHVERYNRQLQGAFTQKTQELAQQRAQSADFVTRLQSDPEFQTQQFRQLAAQLGYQLEEPQEDLPDPFADPYEHLDQRLSAIEQERLAGLEQARQDEVVAHIEGLAEQQLDQLGLQSEAQRDWVVSRAIALPPIQGPGGIPVPDVQSAHRELLALLEEDHKARIASKRAPRVGSGIPGEPAPDLSTEEGRTRHMASIVEAHMHD